LLAVTLALSLRIVGVSAGALARAVAPPLGASLAMAATVAALDSLAPASGPAARLALLVPAGAALYAGLLLVFARPIVVEVTRLVRRAPEPQAL
jgi:hypothetical protein